MPIYMPNWIPKPFGVADCPPGLEYLSIVKLIFVKEYPSHEIGRTPTFWIKNESGRDLYCATFDEQTQDCCTLRPSVAELTDNTGNVLIRLDRQTECNCIVETRTMEVYAAPVDEKIGSVVEGCSFGPSFSIQNVAGEDIYLIRGESRDNWSCSSSRTFQALSLDDETEVGKIRKYKDGWRQELTFGSYSFEVSFPLDLDVRTKALLLGASFLIGYIYFQTERRLQLHMLKS